MCNAHCVYNLHIQQTIVCCLFILENTKCVNLLQSDFYTLDSSIEFQIKFMLNF